MFLSILLGIIASLVGLELWGSIEFIGAVVLWAVTLPLDARWRIIRREELAALIEPCRGERRLIAVSRLAATAFAVVAADVMHGRSRARTVSFDTAFIILRVTRRIAPTTILRYHGWKSAFRLDVRRVSANWDVLDAARAELDTYRLLDESAVRPVPVATSLLLVALRMRWLNLFHHLRRVGGLIWIVLLIAVAMPVAGTVIGTLSLGLFTVYLPVGLAVEVARGLRSRQRAIAPTLPEPAYENGSPRSLSRCAVPRRPD